MDYAATKRRQVLDALNDVERLSQQGGLFVGQVMTGCPSCIAPDMPALELIHLFHAKQFRHLLVLNEENVLIGVISDRDVIRCLGPKRHPEPSVLDGIAARDIMSTDLITVTPGASLEQAVDLMIEHGVSCLPVQIDSTLVGILTNTDLNVILQTLLQTVCWSSSAQSDSTAPLRLHN
jgi:acetoin utilization protein AcuB